EISDIVHADVQSAQLPRTDIDQSIVDEALRREPQRTGRIAVNAIAKQWIAGLEAGEQYCPWANARNCAFEVDVPPVDRRVEPAKETRLEHEPHGSRGGLFGLKIWVAANNKVVAADLR